MRDCLYNSVVQQLLQTPLVVLIDIYFEVMRTLIALVVTILCILYSVACVQIQLRCPFFRNFIEEDLTFLLS